MSKARNRPPRLETNVGHQEFAPPPTLRRAAGTVARHGSGRDSAVRRRCAAWSSARRANGLPPVLLDDTWAVRSSRGLRRHRPRRRASIPTSPSPPRPCCRGTDRRSRRARARTSRSRRAGPPRCSPCISRWPGSPRISGGDVVDDDDDSSPLRVDGRSARALRWVDGVAVVTDGESLCATRGPDGGARVAVPGSSTRARRRRRPVRRRRARRRHRSDRARPGSSIARSRSRRRRGRDLPRDPDVDRPAARRVPAAARDGARRRRSLPNRPTAGWITGTEPHGSNGAHGRGETHSPR